MQSRSPHYKNVVIHPAYYCPQFGGSRAVCSAEVRLSNYWYSKSQDFGIPLQASVRTDASAALAITQRQGLGKLRHIDVHWLWIQERIKAGDLSANKVPGKENPADLLTKHLSGDEIQKHMRLLNFWKIEGRADKSLTMNSLNNKVGDHWNVDYQYIL